MVPFLQLYLNSINKILPVHAFTRSYGSVPRFVSRRKECLSLPRQTSSSPLATRRGKGKIYWRAVSFFTELYWPVSSSRFPFLLAGFSRAFLLVSLLDPISNLPLSVLGAAFLYCLVEISSILTRIDSTRERQRREKGGERSWDWYGAWNYFDSR